MPNVLLWDAAPTSEGTILTTELNALGDAAWTVAGTEYDNSTDLRQFFQAVVAVDFVSAPTATGFVSLYAIKAVDGSNYETLDSDNDPRADKLVAVISLIDTTAAQIRASGIFTLPGCKVKFILKNSSGQAFPATGSTVTLYSQADELQ